ncbi:MAG: putative transporter [Planctomycetes bacterium]|nr:putative transporter [Planctomycetota bacterium]
MRSLLDLSTSQPIAHAILILSFVIVAGLVLGTAKVRGVRLGSAGVLFSGIICSHFGARIDHELLDFVKEFGLVLFVFMIGLQLGPSFFGAIRKLGLRLNLLAAAVVLLGSGLAVVLGKILHLPAPGTLGVLTGATTNTPSMAAAQQTYSSIQGGDEATSVAMGYAVAYPLGIIGIIASLAIIRSVFRIDAPAEAAALAAAQAEPTVALERRALVVLNGNLDGLSIAGLPHIKDFGVQIARHRAASASGVTVAHGGTVLHVGDHISVVGPPEELDAFERLIGRRTADDLTAAPGEIRLRRIVVTRKRVVGRRLADLHLGQRMNVKVTRVIRSGVEMAAFGGLVLQFGDVLSLIGDDESLARAGEALGNSPKALDETHFMPIFLGIALGVIAGVLPITIPGLPEPVRLGLAGGPLILAIILSRVGNIGPLVWYVPQSAKLAFRELGITLFLACVGLKAGEKFVATVMSENGALWIALAAIVATVPPIAVGVFARRALRMNYATLSGVLAGSMTDPPALAFAGGMCKSEAPSLAYATVYPVTMMMRIVLVQVLILVVH